MAVTISQSPDKYTPSDNPIIWVWYSNATGNPNFSYIVELYIDAVLDSSHQIFPELGGGYAHFDVSEIIRAKVPTAQLTTSTIVNDASNYRSVYIIIREFYGTTPAFGASATSSTIYPFKACIENSLMDTWDYTDWKISNDTKRFLTDSPNDIRIREGQDYYVTIITDAVADQSLFVVWYDIDGNVVGSADYYNITYTSYRITQINLNSDLYLSFLTQPVLDTVEYVEFYFADSGNVELSETKRFYLDRGCNYGAELIWLNKYGGFDVYNYSHNIIRNSDIETKQFEQQYGGWEDVTYSLNSLNSGVRSYFKTAKDRLTLVSSYVNADTQNWLVESAYISPLVYLFGTIREVVNITSSSYLESNDRFVEEITEVVELSLCNGRKSVVI